MTLVILGLIVFGITAAIFWYCLPRGGQRHRFVETEWEPYIGVAFTAGIALGFTMLLSGTLGLLG